MGLVKMKIYVAVFMAVIVGTVLPKLCDCATGESQTGQGQDEIVFYARNRTETPNGSARFGVVENQYRWNPKETAVIICDMWDKHWCKGATSRVSEMAPRMNEFVCQARGKGVFIIHAPSDCMDFYKDHTARKRAKTATQAANLPNGIGHGCGQLSEREKAAFPIDHSDGGCDCQPQCQGGSPWKKQIDTIKINEEDAITDSGIEAWNLLEQRNIDNVIILGVHTNMCVLGRPFGLRNMAQFGKNVVLVRDLTDTMYNSRSKPFVSHFTGTDLVVEHIERYVCPTITSTVFTGKAPFRFKDDKRPRVVLISAESEYDAALTLPEFANELELNYGLACQVLQGNTKPQGDERNNIPNIEALAQADVAILFARRRALPADQMKCLKDYLSAKKPLIALRTSSHAFAVRPEPPQGLQQWEDFDREVLGCRYNGYHYGETLACVIPQAATHPILKGLTGPYQVRETMYRSSPLAQTCTPLLLGKCVDGKGDDNRYRKKDKTVADEPIAWVNNYNGARIFYTSLGNGRASFKQPWFRQMLVNAVFWSLEKPIPQIKAKNEN